MSGISAAICLLLLGASSMAVNLPTNQQDSDPNSILRPFKTYLLINCQGTELKPVYDGDVLLHAEINKDVDEEGSCKIMKIADAEQQDRELMGNVVTIECGLTLVYIGHSWSQLHLKGIAQCPNL